MLEIAGIIILGILAQWLAWRTRIPAILPLILTGLAVGPVSTFFTMDGSKLIEPIYQPQTGKGLFPGQSLFYFVSLSIGIILFEGGLTLKRREIAGIGYTVLKLITLGSVVTFFGAGVAVHYLMGLSWSVSFLFAALIIVTGPTVIAPILRNIPLTKNVANVLKWEGILIDPIGALVAVLVFEFIISGESRGQYTWHALLAFAKILATGITLGALTAYALYHLMKKEFVPHYLMNVFTLALVLAAFVGSDFIAMESGLLTVVVMGMVLGNLKTPRLKEILYFKESMSVLLISVLFILLSANIDTEHLLLVLEWPCLLLFAIVILVLRPIGVFLSTNNEMISTREKLFIAWVGPRGIVAAGMASLFGIKLTGVVEGAEYLTPLVFMIVLGTVLLNATTARMLARWLGVTQEMSNGILIIGANPVARLIAKYLKENDRHVVLADINEKNVIKAKEDNLEAFQVNIYFEDLADHFELLDVGYLIAMTSSTEVNHYACQKYKHDFGELGTFRPISPEEMRLPKDSLPKHGLLSHTDDFINLSEVARDFPHIHEMPLLHTAHLQEAVSYIHNRKKSIPLFIKMPDGFLDIIPQNINEASIEKGSLLVYMGQLIKAKEILPPPLTSDKEVLLPPSPD